MSAQFHAAAVEAHPEISGQIANGELGTLRGWLRDYLHQHGAKLTAAELIRRATSKDMSIEPYLDCLWRKYQPLYRLEVRERHAVDTA